MVESLQVLRNICILYITCHYMPKYFQVNDRKHSNKHVLALRRAKYQTSVFSHDMAANWVLRFLKNKRKTFSVLQNIFFFAPDEGLYCRMAGGGAENMWTNILIFKFLVLGLVIYSVSSTIIERFGDFLQIQGACDLGTQINN